MRLTLSMILGSSAALLASAQDSSPIALPSYLAESPRVANPSSGAAFSMPVSALRFEPLVDLQSRNQAEAQADVTIRGGTFENTGFRIGGVALTDPQTGHYFAEIPVAPAMIGSPRILTGADQALGGFNANVGTVDYAWRPIETGGQVSVGGGPNHLDRESLYQGWVSPGKFGQSTIAFDAELDHARSDGTIAYGDSQFYRYAGRLQARDANSQTDLFFGYQSKFFGWRNLYTPFNVNETENLQTSLAIFNHRQNYGAGSYIEAGAFYRRNKDDYEFNRFVPGQFNPYQHTGWVRGTGFDGRHDFEIFQLNYSGELTGDRLKTTSLLFGPYLSRSLFKLTLVPEKTWALEQGAKFQLRAGASYDDSNRAGSAVSPVVEAALSRSGREGSQQRVYASYTQTSQLPTYTALGSNPTSGLFRGNPNLGRAETHNYEFGGSVADGPWKGQAAIFYRRDNQLVDFTFSHLVTAARTANPVNLDTYGVEGFVSRTSKYCDVVLGYTYLDKNPNYGSAMVDASYYALNYARHRATLSLVARPGAGFEVRADNTYRLQAANLLRTTGGNRSLSTTLGVYYTPPPFRALTVFAQADNLWNDGFQEIPATPAARRQWVFGAVYHW